MSTHLVARTALEMSALAKVPWKQDTHHDGNLILGWKRQWERQQRAKDKGAQIEATWNGYSRPDSPEVTVKQRVLVVLPSHSIAVLVRAE